MRAGGGGGGGSGVGAAGGALSRGPPYGPSWGCGRGAGASPGPSASSAPSPALCVSAGPSPALCVPFGSIHVPGSIPGSVCALWVHPRLCLCPLGPSVSPALSVLFGSVCIAGSVPGSVCALWGHLCPPLCLRVHLRPQVCLCPLGPFASPGPSPALSVPFGSVCVPHSVPFGSIPGSVCAHWVHPHPRLCLCPLGPSPVLSVPIGSIRPCPCLSVSVRPQLCVRPVSLHAPLGPPAVRAAPQPPRRAHTARSPQRRPAVLPAPRRAPLRSAPLRPFIPALRRIPAPKEPRLYGPTGPRADGWR